MLYEKSNLHGHYYDRCWKANSLQLLIPKIHKRPICIHCFKIFKHRETRVCMEHMFDKHKTSFLFNWGWQHFCFLDAYDKKVLYKTRGELNKEW